MVLGGSSTLVLTCELNISLMIKHLVCCCLLIITTFSSAKEAESVGVGYSLNGEHKFITGYKKANRYIFNQESNRIVHLVTLDWPPYIGEHLCNKGWVFQFAVALLTSKGYQVQIEFLPWARAVHEVELGQADILFPEYYIEDAAPSDNVKGKKRRELLALSNEFPGGEIGFIKRKGEKDNFAGNLSHLEGENIGVVRGYQNTPEFDAMMDNNEFNVVKAVDDLQLLRILVAKRVNLVIGDPKVLRFIINYSDLSHKEKTELVTSIEDVEPALKYNPLYFALSNKNPNWSRLLVDINTALYEFYNSGETTRIKNAASLTCMGG